MTSTRPSSSSVAVCPTRHCLSEPVGVHSPVTGSHSSADASGTMLATTPATARTRPSASRVAV